MNGKNSEPRYVISVAARLVGIETHTLRYYERIGLVTPFRSQGKIRYYSESDIDQLRQIRRLVNDLGVNPAGVEVVMRMARMMSRMQSRLNELTEELEKVKHEKPSGVRTRRKNA
jgi:MerR family transcriptional regulator/heat shock protein HspR